MEMQMDIQLDCGIWNTMQGDQSFGSLQSMGHKLIRKVIIVVSTLLIIKIIFLCTYSMQTIPKALIICALKQQKISNSTATSLSYSIYICFNELLYFYFIWCQLYLTQLKFNFKQFNLTSFTFPSYQHHIYKHPRQSQQLTQMKLIDQFHSYFKYIRKKFVIMKRKNQRALVINEYGGKVQLKQIPMPQIKEGEVLIKVEASTINPSDKLLMDGACFQRPLPSICGIEGTGRVVDAKGELASLWIGVRVCFISPAYGSWVEYSVSTPYQIFQIGEDIRIESAACGLINPLTALGFVERYRALKCKYGMINTAAASSLGRMLIRLCKKQKIPLLNIVHRDQQKQLLLAEGADYVIVTKGEWQAQYKEFILKNKFDCLFDALGGGTVTQKLISNLLPGGHVFAYGALEGKPLVINSVIQLLKGLTVQGFLIFSWWGQCASQLQQSIRQNLNEYISNELSTKSLKQVSIEQIDEGLFLSQKKASEGKVILRISKNV